MKCPNCNSDLTHRTTYRVSGVLKCAECCIELPDCYIGGGLIRRVSMEPIVVHRRRLEDGQFQYSYPGRNDDAVAEGYEKVELNSISEADRFVKDRNAEENELRRMQISGEKEYWNERAKERRAESQRELERRLGKSHSRIGEMVQRAIDARREKKFRALASKDVNFHLEALSFDQSNRKEYIDDNNRKISVAVNGFRK